MNVIFAKVKVNIFILSMMGFGQYAKPVMIWNMANAIPQNIVYTNHVSVRKNESPDVAPVIAL